MSLRSFARTQDNGWRIAKGWRQCRGIGEIGSCSRFWTRRFSGRPVPSARPDRSRPRGHRPSARAKLLPPALHGDARQSVHPIPECCGYRCRSPEIRHGVYIETGVNRADVEGRSSNMAAQLKANQDQIARLVERKQRTKPVVSAALPTSAPPKPSSKPPLQQPKPQRQNAAVTPPR